jgi:GntR family transcriptional regulator
MQTAFESGLPIYQQLINEIKLQIVSGAYRPGDRLEPVREMAQKYGVNPNTVQRSMAELERQNLVYSERTTGRFITDDGGLIMQMRQEMADEYTKDFLQKMREMGFDRSEIGEMIQRQLETREE